MSDDRSQSEISIETRRQAPLNALNARYLYHLARDLDGLRSTSFVSGKPYLLPSGMVTCGMELNCPLDATQEANKTEFKALMAHVNEAIQLFYADKIADLEARIKALVKDATE